eukprot:TRINITY_DN1892_c0_g1_i1.p1 TRINITY_DN1892_c0_g1~~TRINITY_DN1892_c0_g1_i1.p1  ORF type:complete len:131 (-),score=23.10 TRINITY_DN1892_c0_g1_i1:77-448(-)
MKTNIMLLLLFILFMAGLSHQLGKCLPCQRTTFGEIAYQSCLNGNCTGAEDMYVFPNVKGCVANLSMRNVCKEKFRPKKSSPIQYYFPELSNNTCSSRIERGQCIDSKAEIYTCGCCWCAEAV